MSRLGFLIAAFVLVLAACGSSEDTTTTTTAAATGPIANACPPDGCSITITDVEAAGGELRVTWDANYLPDLSRNHIHIYWDIYTADEVSSDASERGVDQGNWSPTDSYPEYVTESDASTATRGDSTTVCVTAADRGHVVLDSTIVHCVDVSAQLGA